MLQQIVNFYISVYMEKAYPPGMWREAYKLEIDSERVSILFHRRRFPVSLISWIQLDSASAGSAFNHSLASTINKFILLTLYRKPASPSVFYKTARAVCTRFSENSEECLNEYGLNVSEIASLLGVIIKNLYAVKSKCDAKSYLMNLDRYISWQSLTSLLSRFNPSQRKEILRNFGRKLCTFTQTIDMSKPTYISIY